MSNPTLILDRSIYDSYTWQEKYGDPGFHRHVSDCSMSKAIGSHPSQVAVAKVLGLMALRVADDIVLPLNISQYSLELSSYLEKVASIAKSLNVSDQLQFGQLKESIARVQNASAALDEQAVKALEKLHKLVPRMPRGHRGKGLAQVWQKAVGLVETTLGVEGNVSRGSEGHHERSSHHHDGHKGHHGGKHSHKHKHDKKHHKHPRMPDPKKVKEIKQVLLEIRGINQKLKGYESG